MPAPPIAIVAFDGISPFHLAVPWAIFGEDRRGVGVPKLEVFTVSAEESSVVTSAGFAINGLRPLGDLREAHTIIIPSWRDPNEAPPASLLVQLRESAAGGATVVGLCLGTYVLAAAGLLDGRRATTHWAWATDLSERFPLVEVAPEVLYVDCGAVVTSAGGAAGLDCCLHLLRGMLGAEAAARVARRMVVPPHRQGGQAQYIEQPLHMRPAPDRLAELLEWLQANLAGNHTLDTLAGLACMSRRTFTRRFRSATGATVGAWLLGQRLALAQRLLETTGKSLELVAQESGLGSEASLRHHFGKVLHTSPGRYRREFRGA